MFIYFELHPEHETIVLRTLSRSKGDRGFDYTAKMEPETSFGGLTYEALANMKHGSLDLDILTGLATLTTSEKDAGASTTGENN
jgi:hypothetical protein